MIYIERSNTIAIEMERMTAVTSASESNLSKEQISVKEKIRKRKEEEEKSKKTSKGFQLPEKIDFSGMSPVEIEHEKNKIIAGLIKRQQTSEPIYEQFEQKGIGKYGDNLLSSYKKLENEESGEISAFEYGQSVSYNAIEIAAEYDEVNRPIQCLPKREVNQNDLKKDAIGYPRLDSAKELRKIIEKSQYNAINSLISLVSLNEECEKKKNNECREIQIPETQKRMYTTLNNLLDKSEKDPYLYDLIANRLPNQSSNQFFGIEKELASEIDNLEIKTAAQKSANLEYSAKILNNYDKIVDSLERSAEASGKTRDQIALLKDIMKEKRYLIKKELGKLYVSKDNAPIGITFILKDIETAKSGIIESFDKLAHESDVKKLKFIEKRKDGFIASISELEESILNTIGDVNALREKQNELNEEQVKFAKKSNAFETAKSEILNASYRDQWDTIWKDMTKRGTKPDQLQKDFNENTNQCGIYHFGKYLKHDYNNSLILKNGKPIGFANPKIPIAPETYLSMPYERFLEYAIEKENEGKLSKEDGEIAAELIGMAYFIKNRGKQYTQSLSHTMRTYYTDTGINIKSENSPIVISPGIPIRKHEIIGKSKDDVIKFAFPVLPIESAIISHMVNGQQLSDALSKTAKTKSKSVQSLRKINRALEKSIPNEELRLIVKKYANHLKNPYENGEYQISYHGIPIPEMTATDEVREDQLVGMQLDPLISPKYQGKNKNLNDVLSKESDKELCAIDSLNQSKAKYDGQFQFESHHYNFSIHKCHPVQDRMYRTISTKPIIESWITERGQVPSKKKDEKLYLNQNVYMLYTYEDIISAVNSGVKNVPSVKNDIVRDKYGNVLNTSEPLWKDMLAADNVPLLISFATGRKNTLYERPNEVSIKNKSDAEQSAIIRNAFGKHYKFQGKYENFPVPLTSIDSITFNPTSIHDTFTACAEREIKKHIKSNKLPESINGISVRPLQFSTYSVVASSSSGKSKAESTLQIDFVANAYDDDSLNKNIGVMFNPYRESGITEFDNYSRAVMKIESDVLKVCNAEYENKL